MIQFACPKCGRSIRVNESAAGQKGKCKDCGNVVLIPTPAAHQQPSSSPPRQKPNEETPRYHAHPAMFRNRPVWFVICLLLTPVGAGLVFLAFWWFRCHCTTLTVTNKRSTLRHGFFSKHITEILHRDVRNISVDQSLFQRIFGTGTVGISSSGQGGVEIVVDGMRSPYEIKQIVDSGR